MMVWILRQRQGSCSFEKHVDVHGRVRTDHPARLSALQQPQISQRHHVSCTRLTSRSTKQANFDWAAAVVAGQRGVHPGLEAVFDGLYARRLGLG